MIFLTEGEARQKLCPFTLSGSTRVSAARGARDERSASRGVASWSPIVLTVSSLGSTPVQTE
jgi:hypothetical protein